jgi:hypothetical protein
MRVDVSGNRLWLGGLIFSLLLGILCRTIWLGDIEYKGDERWTFEALQTFRQTRHIPTLGMGSSAGIPNAGMSVWVFLALGQLFQAHDPLALARAVQITNVAAIGLLLAFVSACVNRAEREPWLWSIALVCVNPISVLFQRKIWPPSIFPIFTLALLWGWWYRQYRWGALLWGLVGTVLGQIQLGGFFFTAGFALWTFLCDRKSNRWRYWLLGSALGTLPMLPWLVAIVQSDGPTRQPDLGRVLQLPFYQHWLSLTLGTDLKYSLGDHHADFLSQPAIAGHPLFLVTALLIAVVGLFAWILVRFCTQVLKACPDAISFLVGRSSSSTFTIGSAFWGYGILLTSSLAPIYLHYSIILFNLPYLALAWMALYRSSVPPALKRSRLALLGVCICQFLLTMSFLGFIHNQQVIHGDYGTTYQTQYDRQPQPFR